LKSWGKKLGRGQGKNKVAKKNSVWGLSRLRNGKEKKST
jgi:hypothetical protein